MRRLRIAVSVLFLASTAVFVGYQVKTRMVEDHKPPVITCDKEEITVSVEDKEKALLQGLKAEDDKDGDLTKEIRVAEQSHFIEKGRRKVTYLVFDKANQAGTLERMVTYSDYHSPRICSETPFRVAVGKYDPTELLSGMRVEDCLDGDLTTQLHYRASDEYYSEELGYKNVTFSVSNSAGDVTSLELGVEVVDWSSLSQNGKMYPSLKEYVAYTKVGQPLDARSYIKGIMGQNAEYEFEKDGQYMSATIDDIGIQSHVDYSTPGVYYIEYGYVTNGLAGITRLYVVVEE